MIRWTKLFENQNLGFWALRLVLFTVQEIPYVMMPLFHPDSNLIMNNEHDRVVGGTEHPAIPTVLLL